MPGAILAGVAELPIREWSYKGSEARHLGPVAEEFHQVFGLGTSERTINPLDLSGVALAAIQGLQAELAEQRAAAEARLSEREREIARLRRELAELAGRVARLEADRPVGRSARAGEPAARSAGGR